VPLIVYTPALYAPVTPAGKVPEEIVAPVPLPPTEKVIFVMDVFAHFTCTGVPGAEVSVIVELGRVPTVTDVVAVQPFISVAVIVYV
jgi:hypothetical protein